MKENQRNGWPIGLFSFPLVIMLLFVGIIQIFPQVTEAASAATTFSANLVIFILFGTGIFLLVLISGIFDLVMDLDKI